MGTGAGQGLGGGLLDGLTQLGNANRPLPGANGASPFDALNNAKDQSQIPLGGTQTGAKVITDRLSPSPTAGMSDDELQHYDQNVTAQADRLKAQQPPVESVVATQEPVGTKPPLKSPFAALSQDTAGVVNDTPSASASPLTATTTPASATANATTASTADIPGNGGEGDSDASGPLSGLFGKKVQGYAGIMKDKLGDAATNPLFQVGLGLLSSGYDGSNPWTQILKNVNGIQAAQIAGQGADLAHNKDSREAQQEALQLAYMQALQRMGATASTGVQDPLNAMPRGSKVIK